MSKYTAEQVRDVHWNMAKEYKAIPALAEPHQAMGDAIDALLREHEADKARVTGAVVSGALFDFLGYLTTRDEAVTFSCSHDAGVAVRVLEEWASKRSLFLNGADVKGWREAVAPMLANAPCSLSEALTVLENWALHGNTLSGDDIPRFRAIADRIAPMLASARAPDAIKCQVGRGAYGEGFDEGWNACRAIMLAATREPEKE